VLFVLSMFSKLMSQASQFAMEGVKNLVVKKHVSFHQVLRVFNDYTSQSHFILCLSEIIGLWFQNSGVNK